MDDLEGPWVPIAVMDQADATHAVPGGNHNVLDAAELVVGLLLHDLVEVEPALGVVEHAEVSSK